MVISGRHYTMADLLDFPDDDQIYDIVGGELIVHNVPGLDHGSVTGGITGLLFEASRAGYGYVFAGTHAVALDFPARGWAAKDVTHPDLSFVRRGREGILGERAVEGVPDLVVEILSPSTRDEHAEGGAIRDAYERHGVPYYWLVDLQTRTLRQLTLVGEPYVGGRFGEPVILYERDNLTCPLFPDLSFPMAWVFGNTRGRRPGSDNPS